MDPRREVRPLGIACREVAHGRENFAVVVASGKGVEDFADASDRLWHGDLANRERFRHVAPFVDSPFIRQR